MSKAKKIILVFLSILTISTLVLSVPVSATGTTYNMPFAQPLASDTAGYIECLMSSGDIYVYSFQSTSVLPDSAYVDVTPTSVTLRLNRYNATDSRRLSVVYALMDTGPYYTVNSFVGDVSSLNVSPYVPSYYTIVSVKAYGFIRVYASGGVTQSNNFQVIYGADVVVSNQINNLIAIITNQNTQITDNADKNANEIQANADKNASQIQQNQDKNTDKIINAGSDKAQPDFGSTNDQLDSTTAEMQAVENGYKIDEAATTQELNKGSAFISSTDMQRASVQVKSWIEEFASENKVFSSFLVAALCLGLCFWVIGRKTSK